MAIPLTEFLCSFDRTSLAPEVAASAAKRTELLKRFPISGWPALPLDRYALGTPNSKESFCYHIEYGSKELGSIKGGSADKHLIYFSDETNDWSFESGRYHNIQLAWDAIRAGFVEALRLGSEGISTGSLVISTVPPKVANVIPKSANASPSWDSR